MCFWMQLERSTIEYDKNTTYDVKLLVLNEVLVKNDTTVSQLTFSYVNTENNAMKFVFDTALNGLWKLIFCRKFSFK